METKIIDGKYYSAKLLGEVSASVIRYHEDGKRTPCLAVVLVGDDPASHVYVRNKKNACKKVGINSLEYNLPKDTSESELLSIIENLNRNIEVDGILVQLPLPSHIDANLILEKIDYHKDVDGYHKYNIGALATNSPVISSCTPHGVMYLLDSINVICEGKHAVVVGASNVVGRPMALELLNRHATVTICNIKTKDLSAHTKHADIVVVAVGKPNLITGEMLKTGAILIDVGINRLDNGKLVGDANFDSCYDVVSKITPVPGGVGPMTVAMLLQNTLTCYANSQI